MNKYVETFFKACITVFVAMISAGCGIPLKSF